VSRAMRLLKSALLSFVLFAALLGALSVFWTLVLGVAMRDVWDELPQGVANLLGSALLVFALASGLALYLFLLARSLRAAGIPPASVRWHLATTGLVPVAAAVIGAFLVVANMRLGW